MFRKNWSYIFILLHFIILFTACKKDEEKPATPKEDKYLVDYQKSSSLTLDQVKLVSAIGGFADLSAYIKNGVTVYKVNYITSYKGKDITASGLICIPDDFTAAASLLSFQHGTTFAHSDAPSAYQAISGYELFSSAGYVTLVPDFIGYGSSKDILHPYYNYAYTSGSVVDLIRAAKEFCAKLNIKLNDKLFLAGYSEGGYATLATQKAIEGNPDLGLTITASAAGAGGYNLNGILQYFLSAETYPNPSYLAFIVQSYNVTNDWNRPLTDFFQEPYASKIPGLLNGTLGSAAINQQLTDTIKQLLSPEFISRISNDQEGQLLLALHDNSVNDWKPVSPTRMYHGEADESVPFSDSQQTFQLFNKNGATSVEFFSFPDATHSSGIQPMFIDIIPWFDSFK